MSAESSIFQRVRSVALAAAGLVCAGGFIALLGWLLDSPLLKSGVPGLVAMNPVTALLFVISAVALAVSMGRRNNQRVAHIRAGLGLVIAAVGVAVLGRYLGLWNLAIDGLVFRAHLAGNRMAPNTAVHFVLVGASLLFLDAPTLRLRALSQACVILALIGSAVSLLGYGYDARQMYGIGPHIPMALNTATLFAIVALSILASRPEKSVFANLAAQDAGGAMARRLLPAAITIPIILGFFRIAGQRAGWYGTEFGASLMVVVTVVLLVAAVLITAAALSRADREQKAAQAQIQRLNQELEQRVEERTAELRIRDEQLRQSQKMEAIGQLAGGVAHDFNNLLTIIIGYSDVLASNEVESSEDGKEMLDEIRKAAERAAHLTRQLLAFSRKQILEPRIINLNGIVTETEKMLRRLIGEDISIHLALARDLDCISADPGQIEQVILNLVVNARDAMPQGGELSIETATTELDATYGQSHAEVIPGRYVMLAVCDSGCGMDAATKARIFEPFFTTKGLGKGTGLGLATVYGIVRQSGGYIWVYSEPGQGTTFKIYFPVAAPAAEKPQTDTDRAQALRGSETVLLVEDEDGVRALSRSVLSRQGYTVLEAREPTEAIHISQTHPGTIDVLLTDVVMPHLNGKRLSELLKPDRPDMKVIFMSGYTDDAIVRQGILDVGVNFVQKPFTPTGLATKVREVLDGMSA